MKRADGWNGRKMSWAGVWIHFAGCFIQSQIIPPRPAEILRSRVQKVQRVKEQKLKPPHTTKPNVAGAEARVAVAAIGAPRVVGVEVPSAAAQHTPAPRCRPRCRSAWITTSCIRPIPIPTPLPHIPSHVVKAISVRRKGPHWTRVRRPSDNPN